MFDKKLLITNILILMATNVLSKPAPDADAYYEDSSEVEIPKTPDCFNVKDLDIQIQCAPQEIEIRFDNDIVDERKLFVEHHEEEPGCSMNLPNVTRSFVLKFGTCGINLIGNKASLILLEKRNQKINIGNKWKQHIVSCIYPLKNATVKQSVFINEGEKAKQVHEANMKTPNTTYNLVIKDLYGNIATDASPGAKLTATVSATPKYIYVGVKNCYIKPINGKISESIQVTDEKGCATNKMPFGQWEYKEGSVLQAQFSAIQFPSSNDGIELVCDTYPCYKKCQPTNCPQLDSPCQ